MKHKYVSLLLLGGIIYANTFAQPAIIRQRTIGGNSSDILQSISLTKDGGCILGGHSYSTISGEKTENPRGGFWSDYWIVKLDKAGKIQWDKTIGGNNTEFLDVIQQTRDGGYILGGSSESDISGEKTQNSRGLRDYWLVKLDNQGNIQWDKTIGGSADDALLAMQQTSDGGYILGGASNSNISGEKTQNSRGDDDYWVVKVDASGNVVWDKTIGGNDFDLLLSVQQTSDGGYIVGGYSYSNLSGEKKQNSRGAEDYWVVKLNSQGQIQWSKTIGGSQTDQLWSLQQTSDGGYILGGLSNSNISGEKRQNSKGKNDYWVVKLNNLGVIQWDKTIGGSSGDGLHSLQQTLDGGYILVGESFSNISGDKTENRRNSTDYWVVKINSSGTPQWDKTIGGTDRESYPIIKEISNNLYILGGSTLSGRSGDKTQVSRGSDDYWVVWLRYQTPATLIATTSENGNSITQYKNTSKKFIIYPNPAKDVLNVQTNGKTVVALTDQSGKDLLMQTIEGNGIINISNLTPGIYYLKNKTTGEVQKVLVIK